jgi:hypothetical protein
MPSADPSTAHSIEECLERIDHTRALLERQLTELHGLCMRRFAECEAAGNDTSQCYDLHGLSGHLMGLAIAAIRLDGATDDNIRTLLNLILKREA